MVDVLGPQPTLDTLREVAKAAYLLALDDLEEGLCEDDVGLMLTMRDAATGGYCGTLDALLAKLATPQPTTPTDGLREVARLVACDAYAALDCGDFDPVENPDYAIRAMIPVIAQALASSQPTAPTDAEVLARETVGRLVTELHDRVQARSGVWVPADIDSLVDAFLQAIAGGGT